MEPMQAGVLNVSKPAGATSFSVVRRLREVTGARRVGHAGTLDPLATGVLPILFEGATRLSDFAHRLPKTYEADVHFGFRTATDDAEGEPEPVADPSGLQADEVAAALARFVGRVEQQPPAYSAVKVEGQRAYRRARAGEPSRPAARLVEIHSAEVPLRMSDAVEAVLAAAREAIAAAASADGAHAGRGPQRI